MKKYYYLPLLFCLLFFHLGTSQNNNIQIVAAINTETHEIKIQQETTFFNKSDSILTQVYFHNWANAYRDKNTPLAKRFVEKNSKIFHFTKEKNRGKSTIENILIDNKTATYKIPKKSPDILIVNLENALKPGDSVVINSTYIVTVPNDKFTRYGTNGYTYNLRYWYLAPAVYDHKWIIYNNLDLDDMYLDYTNYNIKFTVPKEYILNSDITATKTIEKENNIYHLLGNNRLDIELNLTQFNDFSRYNSKPVQLITNLNSEKLNFVVKTDILNRELSFIESYLGKYPYDKLLINRIDYEKDPVYGFNQLPKFLRPFSDNFEWDIMLFKTLVRKYINNLFLFNQREDIWLADGLQTYLMMKYVEKYYPEVKAIGNISKIWGIKSYNLAKLDFNDKNYFVYQFASRKNLDQSLDTPADSLSNFNRKIANKYKAGIGIKYLENYLGEKTITNAIVEFSAQNAQKKTESDVIFETIDTSKNLDWFKNGYIKTSKKPDYKIKKVIKSDDSLEVVVKNIRDYTVPIELFGIQDNEIKFQKWLTNIDSVSSVTIPRNGFDKLSLNYESLLPEFNLRNNWKNVNPSLFTRPLQLRILKDIENPYYNQLFYTPTFGYNYYNGVILGMSLGNQTFLNKRINYKFTPSYSIKSNSLSGSYAIRYEHIPLNGKVNKLLFGFGGSNFDYAPNLPYTKLVPYAALEFKKKNYRDISSNAIGASYTFVNKAASPNETQDPETLKYNVLSLGYGYSKPDIIKDMRFSTQLQMSNLFSKVELNAQYRFLTNTNTQFDFRFFAGAFLKNNTNTNFFSFALDRPTDYLFQYDYLGRSETTGFFSQQIIIAEGGFKSKLPVAYANQWITSVNTSFGVWRWVEIYNDVALVKNKNENIYFGYEGGVRLNFVQNILEVYFPVYSNLGFEVTESDYPSRIRFVLVLKPKKIINFLRRGFY